MRQRLGDVQGEISESQIEKTSYSRETSFFVHRGEYPKNC